jgi:hypothetical protein
MDHRSIFSSDSQIPIFLKFAKENEIVSHDSLKQITNIPKIYNIYKN